MKINKTLTALIAGASFGLSGQVFAEGTAAGTTITNTVTLGYTVSTVPQTDLTLDVDFLVDTKVDFNLSNDETATVKVTPKGNNYISTYTLNSDSNDTLDFSLATTDLGAGDQDFLTGTVKDNFQLDANLSIFVEEGTTLGYQPLVDTATTVENLGAEASVKIYVIVTTAISDTQVDGDIAAIELAATALQSDGSAIPDQATSTFTPGTKQFVIADPDLDKKEVLNTAFEVGTANFTDPTDATDTDKFTLTVKVINDLLCDTTLSSTSTDDNSAGCTVSTNRATGIANTYVPKAIPGAMVEFTLKAKNSGSIDATAVQFSENLSTVTDDDPLITFAIVQNSLNTANIGITFPGAGTGTATPVSTDSTTNLLDVDVTTFEVGDDITITFTAIIE